MSLISNAANELVLEMRKQGRETAVYYTLNTGNGFHDIIMYSDSLEVLNLENNVEMVIEEINITELEVLALLR